MFSNKNNSLAKCWHITVVTSSHVNSMPYQENHNEQRTIMLLQTHTNNQFLSSNGACNLVFVFALTFMFALSTYAHVPCSLLDKGQRMHWSSATGITYG